MCRRLSLEQLGHIFARGAPRSPLSKSAHSANPCSADRGCWPERPLGRTRQAPRLSRGLTGLVFWLAVEDRTSRNFWQTHNLLKMQRQRGRNTLWGFGSVAKTSKTQTSFRDFSQLRGRSETRRVGRCGKHCKDDALSPISAGGHFAPRCSAAGIIISGFKLGVVRDGSELDWSYVAQKGKGLSNPLSLARRTCVIAAKGGLRGGQQGKLDQMGKK